MNRARALIEELASAGVTLRIDGEFIVHRGRRSEVTPERLASLRQYKSEVITELQVRAEADLASRDIEVKSGSQTMDAGALRFEILAALDRLPATKTTAVCQLLVVETRKFLDSEWLREAIEAGWTPGQLFGIDRQAPEDPASWGVVVGLAMATMSGDTIESVDAERFVIKFRGRRPGNEMRRVDKRFPPTLSSVPWWECVSMLEDDVRGRCPSNAARLPAPEKAIAASGHLAPPDDGAGYRAGEPTSSRSNLSLRPLTAVLDWIRRAFRRGSPPDRPR